MKKNTSRTINNCRKAIRTLFRFRRKKTTCPEGRRPKRNSPPATTWGVKKFSSYRELVMEAAAKKRLAIMPAKERLKKIRAAIADGLCGLQIFALNFETKKTIVLPRHRGCG